MPTVATSRGTYSWSSGLDNLIVERSAYYGVPLDISYAIIAAESGFDARVGGDCGGNSCAGLGHSPGCCSWGLLQLHLQGQGAGHYIEELQDPYVNLTIGLEHIGIAFRQVWTREIDQFEYVKGVMFNSGHPCNTPDTFCDTPGVGRIRCDDVRSHCYASAVRTFDIWRGMLAATREIVANTPHDQIPPVITPPGSHEPPFVMPTPPWIMPTLPLWNIGNNSNEEDSGLVTLALLGIAGYAVYRFTQKPMKKIVINQPSASVNINKYGGKISKFQTRERSRRP